MNPADVAQSLPSIAASDLSLWSLFWHASWVVKLVMLGLLAASVWVWAIVIDKTLMLSRNARAMRSFEASFWSGQSLEELYRTHAAKPTNSMAALFVAAMQEWKRSFSNTQRSHGGLQMRLDKVMQVTIAREIERLE